MFHNYETEIITRKASDVAEYMELFGSSCYSLNVCWYMHRAWWSLVEEPNSTL